jgi:flagellin
MNNNRIGKDVEKLSSGYRVNRAADDAAGLAISEKMRTQIRGLSMASRNSQDGISLVQTAEGAMQTAHDIMQRMRELAVQSANGTNDDAVDRFALDLEFQQLNKELLQIQDTVKFNDMTVFERDFTLQTGANEGDTTDFSIGRLATINDAFFVLKAFDEPDTRLPPLGTALPGEPDWGQWPLSDSLHWAAFYNFNPDGEFSEEFVDLCITHYIETLTTFDVDDPIARIVVRDLLGDLIPEIAVGAAADAWAWWGQHTDPGGTTWWDGTWAVVHGQLYPNGENDISNPIIREAARTVLADDVWVANLEQNTIINFHSGIATMEDARTTLNAMTVTINELSLTRASLGAVQNRLEYKIQNLDNSTENLSAAESRIRDVDMAKQMTEFTKNNILFQASTAMLAQANALPQGVLQLLG